MKNAFLRTLCAASIPFAIIACSNEPETPTEEASEDNGTLAEVLAQSDDFGTIAAALSDTGLASVFEGQASYTVLAPTDDAFDTLDAQGIDIDDAAQKPIVVALLREHVLPGHLTANAVRTAVSNGNGSATMTTLGGGTVTFTADGETLSVSHSAGGQATLADGTTNAGNGSLLPIDSVLAVGAAQ